MDHREALIEALQIFMAFPINRSLNEVITMMEAYQIAFRNYNDKAIDPSFRKQMFRKELK